MIKPQVGIHLRFLFHTKSKFIDFSYLIDFFHGMSYNEHIIYMNQIFGREVISQMPQKYVFISYSSQNQDSARELRDVLDQNGIRCWMDIHSIRAGGDFGTEIRKAIDDCGLFVLLVSRESQNSQWVPKELNYAISTKKRIIPLLIDPYPVKQFKLHLANVQCIQLYGRKKQAYAQLLDEIPKEWHIARNSDVPAKDSHKSARKVPLVIALIAVIAAVFAVVFIMQIPEDTQHEHMWIPATCTSPQTCSICGLQQGVHRDHSPTAVSCTTDSVCTLCGAVVQKALGHSWVEATYSKPETCSRCQTVRGGTLTDKVIAEAKNHGDSAQYRYAIQILDKAWKESGNQRLFDLAADYRMEFGIHASTILAAGKYNSMVRYADGSVWIVGDNEFNELSADSWKNIAAIGMGDVHTLGLRQDGTVVMVSEYDPVLLNHYEYENWRNVIAISSGDMHTVALLSNGTIVSDGYQRKRECDTGALMAKAGKHKVVAIAAGFHQTLALLDNGTVIADGADSTMTALNVGGWTDIAAIAAGSEYSAGLRSDGTVVVTESSWDVSGWEDIVALAAGDFFLLGLRADGTVVSVGSKNVPDVSGWEDIVCLAAGNDHAVAVDSQGYLWSAGSNEYGQFFPAGSNINH
jgi:alpha-tubulin suppressor-like RCC1 family protein